MDNADKSPSGLPGASLIWVLLIAAGALVVGVGTLTSSRPTPPAPRLEFRPTAQDIDARLWQDPIGAVNDARDKAAKLAPATPAPHDIGWFARELQRRAQHRDGPRQIVVLAAMVFGGPYAEQIESRRRTRYAVLGALNMQGFAPVDNEHLGYFVTATPGVEAGALPAAVPFEFFEEAPLGSDRPGCGCLLVLLWLDSQAFAEKTATKLAWMAEAIAVQVAASAAASASGPAAASASALAAASASAAAGAGNAGTPTAVAAQAAPMHWRVLGPASSGGLRTMLDEDIAPQTRQSLKDHDFRFIAPNATVPDDALLPARAGSGARSVTEVLEAKGVTLVRATATDRQLAATLVAELRLRGLQTRSPKDGRPAVDCDSDDTAPEELPSTVAIVSEWDTLYGRSLRQQFRYEAREGRAPREGFCVRRWQYLRGLDGNLPGEPATSAVDARTRPDGKAERAEAVPRDSGYLERPEGQSQYDYLRRLATRIRDEDAALRARRGPDQGIRAIGVLGNDVFDKLLVLQALQSEMPQAIFFTTDLDARLFHPREQPWTRNLIVASSFGLRLSDDLQRGVPPFRDSYQTATFLAAQMAVVDALAAVRHPAQGALFSQPDLDRRWFTQPRLFEVSRSGVFDFSDRDAPGRRCSRRQIESCDTIHPPGTDPAPEPNLAKRVLIFGPILLLLWLPALLLSRGAARQLRRFVAGGRTAHGRATRRGLLAIGAVSMVVVPPLLAAWAWPHTADWMTLDGKPLSMTEGISPWPTYGIRLATLLLCLLMVARAWSALRTNLDRITHDFRLGSQRRLFAEEVEDEDRQRTRSERLLSMLSVRFHPERLDRNDPPTGISRATARFWKHYVVQDRAGARLLRTALCLLATIALGLLIRWAVGAGPSAPQRGALSATMELLTTVPAGIAALFLIYFVADATLLCVLFVRGLRMHRTSWPPRTLQRFHNRTGIPAAHLNDWISLAFVARRTRCVGGLIYYPFIVLSLLVLARSTFFDRWFTPPSFVALSALSFAAVLVCALALRRTAEASRSAARSRIDDAILRAKGGDATLEKQLVALRERMLALKAGAFAPYSQQPLLRAVLLPMLTLGTTSLFDYLAMLGF